MEFAENGFEIREQADGILLVDRRIWGLTYAAVVLATAGILLLAVALLALVRSDGVRIRVPESLFIVAGVACLLPEPFLLRRIRERKQAASEDMESFLFLDLQSRELRDHMGTALARFDDLEVALRIDWMTRGWGRLVTLTWPGGVRIIFRTSRRGLAVDVLQSLAGKGIAARSRRSSMRFLERS